MRATEDRPVSARARRRPAGRPREQVSGAQRVRILSAMAEVACEQGVEAATVARIVESAGVSRRTFYDLFGDRRECFVAVFDESVALAARRMVPAYERQGRWVDAIRVGLLELLRFLDEEPELARVCVVHALAGDSQMLERRAEVLKALARAVEAGRAEARGVGPPPLTAEGVVGAVLAVVHARLVESRGASLTELLGPLMGLIALPYLGSAAARRELLRPTPVAPGRSQVRGGAREALEGLSMRLTYRTLRVLAVIAGEPGISNREVADRAEIADQGQVSKLLARLERLGLICNGGAGQARGAKNAWHMTPRGAEVQGAIAIDAS